MTFAVDGPVVVAHHPAVAGAEAVAQALAAIARAAGRQAWVEVLHEGRDGDPAIVGRLRGAALLVCVGGDGTVLRAAAFAAQAGVPIFGVRMGRLGFLTETIEPDALVDLRRVLGGEARLERHAMLQARVNEAEPVHALNDVVPVAPHLTRANPLVLPAGARLRLSVERGEEARITADGLFQWPVESGTVVEVTASPRFVDFVRLGAENQFYASLARRLGWLRPDHVMEVPDGPAA